MHTQNVSSDDENDPTRTPSYAPLHDFCMMIPYAAASLAVGLVATAAMGAGVLAWATLANGAAMAALAALSLRSWKAGVLSKTYASIGFGTFATHITPITRHMCATVSTSALWCLYYPFLHAPGQAALQHAGLMSWVAVTSAMMVFLLVNVLAGGNPPKGHEGSKQA